jgi:hypothetical protein
MQGFSPEYVKKWTRDLVDKTGVKVYSVLEWASGMAALANP